MKSYIIAAENTTEEQRSEIEKYFLRLNGTIIQSPPDFFVLTKDYEVSCSLKESNIVLRFVSGKEENIETAIKEALKICPEFKRVKINSEGM